MLMQGFLDLVDNTSKELIFYAVTKCRLVFRTELIRTTNTLKAWMCPLVVFVGLRWALVRKVLNKRFAACCLELCLL